MCSFSENHPRWVLPFLFCLGLARVLVAQEIPGWNLVWSDEFEQADGSVPDPAKWGYETGGTGWGNSEIQYYTNRPENARIEGGQLLIEAREESFGGRDHTSARLLTKGKWDWTYGRIEVRVKVPSGAGLWSACWMLGSDIDSVGWPSCGEIDIMEQVGRRPKDIFGTIHGPGYAGGNSFGNVYTFAADVADDYHVFVVEWDEDLIRWFVDGIPYHTARPADLEGNEWVFDHGHYLLLNLAIDGNFAGPLDPTVSFPQQFWVDYVRVYQRVQPDGANLLINPGFESGSLGAWTGYEPGGVNENGGYVESSSSTYYNGGEGGGDPVMVRSGEFVGKVFGDFTGVENVNGFYQELSAEAGTQWTAGGWGLTHPQDLFVGGNECWVELSFRNAIDEVLSLHRSPVLTASSVTPGVWMDLQVAEELDPQSLAVIGSGSVMQAPEGTSRVRYEVVFRQPLYDGGSMYFDDLSLIRQAAVLPEVRFQLDLMAGKQVRWTAANPASTYQPQRSTNGLDWEDLGPLRLGNGDTSVFDDEGSDFHQVLETASVGLANGVANPGFEVMGSTAYPGLGAEDWRIAAPADEDPSNGSASMAAASSYGSFTPRSGSRMLVLESRTPEAPAGVVAPNVNVRSALIAVEEDKQYELFFHAAHVIKTGGADPQWNLRYYSDGQVFIDQEGYESFSTIGSEWTEVRQSFTTPMGTAWVEIEWIQALGADNGSQWVSLIDDVEILVDNVNGAETVLPASASPGLEISWETEVGWRYQLETSPDLSQWADLGPPVDGTGATSKVVDESLLPIRFYRVESLETP